MSFELVGVLCSIVCLFFSSLRLRLRWVDGGGRLTVSSALFLFLFLGARCWVMTPRLVSAFGVDLTPHGMRALYHFHGTAGTAGPALES